MDINQKLKEMTKLAAELADECEKLAAAQEAKNKTLKRVLDWCETESPDFEIDADEVRAALSNESDNRKPESPSGGSAETCEHIVAYADEKHVKPCPVCELEQVKIKLCHLHGNVTDIKVSLGGIIEDAKRALERCDEFTTRIHEIQQAHGHLRPPNNAASEHFARHYPTILAVAMEIDKQRSENDQ